MLNLLGFERQCLELYLSMNRLFSMCKMWEWDLLRSLSDVKIGRWECYNAALTILCSCDSQSDSDLLMFIFRSESLVFWWNLFPWLYSDSCSTCSCTTIIADKLLLSTKGLLLFLSAFIQYVLLLHSIVLDLSLFLTFFDKTFKRFDQTGLSGQALLSFFSVFLLYLNSVTHSSKTTEKK